MAMTLISRLALRIWRVCFHPVHAWHYDVNQDHFGSELGRKPDCFSAVRRDGHDLEAGQVLQESAQIAEDRLVIVDQEDCGWHGAVCRFSV